VKIFLAGEGRTDLGDWAREPQFRSVPPVQGCVEALLRNIAPAGWSIEGAVKWKDIHKYQSGIHRRPETRNVLGAALRARQAGCEALVFVRDRDGDPDRADDIEAGLREAASIVATTRVAGGVAIRDIEAWVLACRGTIDSQSVRDTKAALKTEHCIEHLEQKSEVFRGSDLNSLPADARSLAVWIDRVRDLFSP